MQFSFSLSLSPFGFKSCLNRLGRRNPPTKLESYPDRRDVAANIHPLESPAADKVPGGREKNLFSFQFPPASLPYLIWSSQSDAGIHKGKSGSRRPSRGAPDPGVELSMGASHGKKVSERVALCSLFLEVLMEEGSLLTMACMYE